MTAGVWIIVVGAIAVLIVVAILISLVFTTVICVKKRESKAHTSNCKKEGNPIPLTEIDDKNIQVLKIDEEAISKFNEEGGYDN